MKKLLYPVLLFLSIIPPLLHGQNTSKPDILILTTGGTIASRTDAPLIEGPELVQAVPQLLDYADIEVEEFVRIGSSKMTPDIWLRLIKRIHAILEKRPDLDGIVITHGTDTMEETAFFLQLTHRRKTPIVLVGSMRSTNEISPDGPANLLNAVRVAADPQAIGKGVLVVLNENISSGRDLRKMNNRRVDAFGATEYGYLGFADPDTVIFYREPVKPHTTDSPFDLSKVEELPPVDIVTDFAGFDAEIFTFHAQRPTEGLIVRSFAGGRTSNGIIEGIRQLPEDSKPVVIASGIPGGRITGGRPYHPALIYATDLPPNKARILLMLALTETKEAEQIRQIFRTY